MHLVTGDYILIGPDHFENIRISRTRDNELWFLSKERGVEAGQAQSEDERRRGDFEEEPEDCVFADCARRLRTFPQGLRG